MSKGSSIAGSLFGLLIVALVVMKGMKSCEADKSSAPSPEALEAAKKAQEQQALVEKMKSLTAELKSLDAAAPVDPDLAEIAKGLQELPVELRAAADVEDPAERKKKLEGLLPKYDRLAAAANRHVAAGVGAHLDEYKHLADKLSELRPGLKAEIDGEVGRAEFAAELRQVMADKREAWRAGDVAERKKKYEQVLARFDQLAETVNRRLTTEAGANRDRYKLLADKMPAVRREMKAEMDRDTEETAGRKAAPTTIPASQPSQPADAALAQRVGLKQADLLGTWLVTTDLRSAAGGPAVSFNSKGTEVYSSDGIDSETSAVTVEFGQPFFDTPTVLHFKVTSRSKWEVAGEGIVLTEIDKRKEPADEQTARVMASGSRVAKFLSTPEDHEPFALVLTAMGRDELKFEPKKKVDGMTTSITMTRK